VRDQGVTSLAELGVPATMAEVDGMLRDEFEALFGPTVNASATP
jgi:lipoyl(octanoyl) transferase